jgi:hypothetical protein
MTQCFMTEFVAAIEDDIGLSVALSGNTYFVILDGDFGTQTGHARISGEGAHDHGGQHH